MGGGGAGPRLRGWLRCLTPDPTALQVGSDPCAVSAHSCPFPSRLLLVFGPSVSREASLPENQQPSPSRVQREEVHPALVMGRGEGRTKERKVSQSLEDAMFRGAAMVRIGLGDPGEDPRLQAPTLLPAPTCPSLHPSLAGSRHPCPTLPVLPRHLNTPAHAPRECPPSSLSSAV